MATGLTEVMADSHSAAQTKVEQLCCHPGFSVTLNWLILSDSKATLAMQPGL